MNEIVSIEGLKNISKELASCADELNNIYNNKLLKVLNECKPYFDDNNISYDKEIYDYNKLYKELYNKISTYSEIVGNSIANSYNETKNNLEELFNGEFLNKYNQIMDKK